MTGSNSTGVISTVTFETPSVSETLQYLVFNGENFVIQSPFNSNEYTNDQTRITSVEDFGLTKSVGNYAFT